MKDRIEKKVIEIIDEILSKDPKDITYNEYRILDNKLSALKWEEDQKAHNKELAELMAKTIGSCSTPIFSALPEVKEE